MEWVILLKHYCPRLIALAIIWMVTLYLLRRAEYSHCHIGWQQRKIVPSDIYAFTGCVCLVGILSGVVLAFETLISAPLFSADMDILRMEVFGVQLCFVGVYIVLCDIILQKTRSDCIARNQPRLDAYIEMVEFNRHFNNRI